ncbi:MAG TPA: hypothetical protein DEP99_02740 [Nitrospiraceae bacterium]|nr:hypothetical protein [Nitrospiraceae bacterium]
MQKTLKDFDSKDAIFIDANIFLHHAFDINPISIEFLKKIEHFNLRVYTSALVLEEITFKLLIQSASNFLSKVTVHGVKTLLKDDKKRKQMITPVLGYMKYIEILKESGLVIIDIKGRDILKAVQNARAYGLITADAAHLSVMERNGIHQIATGDADFLTVSNIIVWSPVEK